MTETQGWKRDSYRHAYEKTINGTLYYIERCRCGWYHRTTLISPQCYDYLRDAKRAAHRHAEGKS